jgi:hypothetical protein
MRAERGRACRPYPVSRQRIVARGDGVRIGGYNGVGVHLVLNATNVGQI